MNLNSNSFDSNKKLLQQCKKSIFAFSIHERKTAIWLFIATVGCISIPLLEMRLLALAFLLLIYLSELLFSSMSTNANSENEMSDIELHTYSDVVRLSKSEEYGKDVRLLQGELLGLGTVAKYIGKSWISIVSFTFFLSVFFFDYIQLIFGFNMKSSMFIPILFIALIIQFFVIKRSAVRFNKSCDQAKD